MGKEASKECLVFFKMTKEGFLLENCPSRPVLKRHQAAKFFKNFKDILYSIGHLPSPSPYRSIYFGDVSEANPQETPRQNQNAHACVAFWNSKMYVNVVSSRRFCYFLTPLVDICGIDFCQPALKSHQNVIHIRFQQYLGHRLWKRSSTLQNTWIASNEYENEWQFNGTCTKKAL